MSASKRADVIGQLQKVLAKHYKPIKAVERTVLEQLLYATCLEDSKPDAADECFARLQESFFDWNEIRVTTVSELSEALRGLKDPVRSATLIKQILHSVFEAIYDFDLETLRKQNLGIAVKQLQSYKGVTSFSAAYVVQNSLGGHSIPVSEAGLEVMRVLNAISEKEYASQSVPGLERAIAKNKGVEFASIFQQLAADYAASPFNAAVRALLMEVDPEARSRLPKRPGKKADEPATSEKPPKKSKPTPPEPPKKATASKAKAASSSAKAVPKKKTVKKKSAPTAGAAKKKSSGKKAPKSIAKKASPGAKKSTSKQLARRKPRSAGGGSGSASQAPIGTVIGPSGSPFAAGA